MEESLKIITTTITTFGKLKTKKKKSKTMPEKLLKKVKESPLK